MNLKKQLADFKASNDSDKIDTIIGSTVIIDGPITTRRAIRVDGVVHGGVTTRANIFTGPDSVINGDVVGRNMTLCGVVNGNVRASGRVIITSRAKISGDLSMKHLVVDEGALFNGSISMTPSDDAQDISPAKE
ncbi:MAG: bactofilin family protein [Saccharofermentanales bacterium]